MNSIKTCLAFSACVLAACACSEISSDIQQNDSKIFFRVNTCTTRGQEVTNANLDGFYVTAMQTYDKSPYFSNLLASSQDKGKTWAASQEECIWPGYALSFYAWANCNGNVTVDSSKQCVEDFTVNSNVKEQKDFIYAMAEGNLTDNAQSGVNLNFHHATAGLILKARIGSENYKVTVYGVKVANLRNKDTFTFSSKLSGYCWSGWNNKKYQDDFVSYKYILPKPKVLDANAAVLNDSENMFLIPQQLNKWVAADKEAGTPKIFGSYISLLVKITTKNGTMVYPRSTEYIKDGYNAAWDAVGVDLELQPEYMNSYVIVFFPDGKDDAAGQQDPDEPYEEDKGGEKILCEPMQYTVSIAEWETGFDKDIDMK